MGIKNFRAAQANPSQPISRNATGITMMSNRKIHCRRKDFSKNQNVLLSILSEVSSQSSQKNTSIFTMVLRRYSLIKWNILCKVTLPPKKASSTAKLSKPCNVMVTQNFCKFFHVNHFSKRETNSKILCMVRQFLCSFPVLMTGLFLCQLKTSENQNFSEDQ